MHKTIYLLFILILWSGFSHGQEITTLDLDPVSISKLDHLNSPYRETNPCLTPDGKYLFFMSGRGGQSWSDPDYTTYHGRREADGDIYYSRKTNGKWSQPVNLGPSVNTEMGEDEPNVTPDGQYVIFQSWKAGWDTTGGPYYISELSGKDWGEPEGLGGNIHRFFMEQIEKNDWYYATDGSALSPDGKKFIFAAGKWYDEPMDLFISYKKEGKWTYPEKIGLNTRGDERSVFIASDSKTLFFSSSGYAGFGGLDIYKTVLNEDGSYEQIVNLGPVFNTAEDDFGFTMNLDGTTIFHTRNGEIIEVELSDPDHLLKPLPTLMINGIVSDYYGNPLEAEILIIGKQDKRLVTRAKSNALTGEYSLAIEKVKGKYIKEINADNYQRQREEIVIKNRKESTVIKSRDFLKKVNSELIFFDLDKAEIRKSEIPKLDSISEYLYAHKRSNVMLTGHADQSGTDEYNLQLSKSRVENVKDYFEKKGIPGRIIRTRYFGESQPLESHPAGEKSWINRRVEVVIIPLDR